MIPKMLKKRIIPFLLCLVMLLVSGCAFLPTEESDLAPPLTELDDVEYVTEPAARRDIDSYFIASVTSESSESYTLSFEERGGYLSELYVTAGAAVNKGDIIATIAGNDIETELANTRLQRQMLQIDLDQALENVPEDGRNYAAEKLRLQIAQCDTTIANLEKNLAECQLVAPANGVVTYLTNAAVGDYVEAKKAICVIADTSSVLYTYKTTENTPALQSLAVGADCTVTVNSVEYETTLVTVQYDYDLDMASFYYLIEARLKDPTVTVDIGKKGELKVFFETRYDVVAVPSSAVTHFANSASVSVLVDGVKTEKTVTVGAEGDGYVEIVSGISEGDEIIIG